MEKFKHIVKSEGFKKSLYIILGLLLLLLTFQTGMLYGFKKAYFSDKVGGDYFMEMRGMNGGFLSGLKPGDFISPHGAVGKIVGIKLPNMTIADKDGNEKNVQISSTTQIMEGNNIINNTDLEVDEMVVVFGSQNDDNPIINAKLVRILPPPNEMMATSGQTAAQAK